MLALLLCIAHLAARPVVRSAGVQLPAPPAAPAIHQLEQQAARDAEVSAAVLQTPVLSAALSGVLAEAEGGSLDAAVDKWFGPVEAALLPELRKEGAGAEALRETLEARSARRFHRAEMQLQDVVRAGEAWEDRVAALDVTDAEGLSTLLDARGHADAPARFAELETQRAQALLGAAATA